MDFWSLLKFFDFQNGNYDKKNQILKRIKKNPYHFGQVDFKRPM